MYGKNTCMGWNIYIIIMTLAIEHIVSLVAVVSNPNIA